MKNLEARKIRKRIRYGTKYRCAYCRQHRAWKIDSRTDQAVCLECGTTVEISKFLEAIR